LRRFLGGCGGEVFNSMTFFVSKSVLHQ